MPGRRFTRKASSKKMGRGLLSVESLHASFEKMDGRLRRAVESGITDTELGHAVDRAWSAAFQQELSAPAIRGLVAHYRALYGGSRAGRKTRRFRGKRSGGQRGGMAPLDWTMGQGTTATTYGRFPDDFSTSAQAVKSLDLTRFFENSVSRSCDATGGRDTLTAQMSNQKGGGLFDSFIAGYAPASVPRNIVETGVSTLQGAPITNPVSAPEVPTWRPSIATPLPFNSSAVSNLAGLSAVYQQTN